MSRIKQRSSGFTIVELLIVIVIIGILAAITVVAYNGITQRTQNTKTIQATAQYIKAFGLYVIDEGDYPTGSGCLGDGYPTGGCLSQDTTAACFGLGNSVNYTSINTPLKKYMNNTLPQMSMQKAECGGTSYVGTYAAYNSAGKYMAIRMILRGNQQCPSMSPNVTGTGSVFSGNATLCVYNLSSP